MTKPLFKGAATAIVTPFKDGAVDTEALKKLTKFQIDNGISAIVVIGTTGEAPTLSKKEKLEAIYTVSEAAEGRVPIIAGTSCNDTASSVALTKEAVKEGADGILAVTPYYNRPTPSGMLRHFLSIAEAGGKPTILYNIPSRTGSEIPDSVYDGFITHPMASGVKEASGSISRCAHLAAKYRGQLDIYSGNDDMTLPVLSVGGKGVISVVSNLFPKQMSELCSLYFEGKREECIDLYRKFLPLMSSLFTETNPIPVKAGMEYLGLCSGELRLPLVKASSECEKKLIASIETFKAP